MPAIVSNFFGTGADTIPVPLGAGIRRTRTDPHFPVTCSRKRNYFGFMVNGLNPGVSVVYLVRSSGWGRPRVDLLCWNLPSAKWQACLPCRFFLPILWFYSTLASKPNPRSLGNTYNPYCTDRRPSDKAFLLASSHLAHENFHMNYF